MAGVPAIRVASIGDAERLSRFAAEAFRATFASDNSPADMAAYLASAFSPDIQRAEIADPGATTFIAEEAGAIAGYVHLVRAGDEMHMKRLYVDAPFKGTGLARALTDRSIALARAEGAARMKLGVWERNPRAIAFYRKLGFVVVGSEVFRLGEDSQTDLVMELRLT